MNIQKAVDDGVSELKAIQREYPEFKVVTSKDSLTDLATLHGPDIVKDVVMGCRKEAEFQRIMKTETAISKVQEAIRRTDDKAHKELLGLKLKTLQKKRKN